MNDLRFNPGVQGNVKVRLEFLHNGIENSSTAYECSERCGIVLHLSRSLAALSCEVIFFNEYLSLTGKAYKGVWQGIENGCDKYFFELSDVTAAPTLRFFYIKLSAGDSSFYIKRYGSPYVTESPKICDLFQLTVSKFEYPKPKKIYGGIIYHIFVDRFRRGGKVPVSDGAKLVGGEWKTIPEYPEYPGAPLKNNTFYGGTLYGIAEKLDYIASLGVTAIYLSPIFRAASNHKYDTCDYMTVDEMFGGEAALIKLIERANSFGISIILDGVFNHTGDDSIYFNKYSRHNSLGAYNSKSSKYYPWYDFQNYPDKYTAWWDISILPRINPDIPECGEFIAGENGVIDKYRKLGIYGFRLDVADELSDKFIGMIKSRLSDSGESILYGEVWEDASNKIAYDVRKKYYQGAELDGVMNYPLRVGIIDYLTTKNTGKLSYALCEIINNAPMRIRNAQMNLLGSHDTIRALTALSGIAPDGKTNAELSKTRLGKSDYILAKKRLMCAYTAVATLPGVPAVFYGDEAGIEGYSDPFCRLPYPWGREDKEILAHYQKIGKVRGDFSVYKEGDFKLLHLTAELLIFARYDTKNIYITVINNSDKDVSLKFKALSKNLLTEKRSREHRLSALSAAVFEAPDNTVFEIISEE